MFGMLALVLLCLSAAKAVPKGSLRGKALDPLGGSVANAKVMLLQQGKEIATSSTDQSGEFVFTGLNANRYSVRVEASGFATQEQGPVFVGETSTANVVVSLHIGSLPQQVVVSATGQETPESQVGASVSLVDYSSMQALQALTVSDNLRDLPGLQVVQTGQHGGTTSLFVRGGDSNFNKVLIDGIPVNDIGGDFEFANLAGTGVEEVEILRGPNSVLYGSDALSSVVNVTTRHGVSTIPQFALSSEGGNFGTYRDDASLAGAFRQFDYFSEFSRFDTQNSLPNSVFHDGTYAGNFGWSPDSTTQVRFTIRHTAVALGDPNALAFFGIPDNSYQDNHDTYWGVTLQNQTTSRWHNLFRFASSQLNYYFNNPSPIGMPFDPFAGTPFDTGPNYLGNVVTIHGANGYSVTGQAILDFGGNYPQPFLSSTTRRSFYSQSDYQVLSGLKLTAGFRYENENGFTNSSGTVASSDRNNYSTFLQATGNLSHRLFATAGVGFENNAVFGFAATPRVSLAYYLRRPSVDGFFGDTKLKFNFGKGIEEPSIFDQGSSLFDLLSGVPGGPAIIAKDHISPVGPERSRSIDFGVDQTLWNRRARLGVTLFHEDFYDILEFVDATALPLLGVPPDAVEASGFGATINSDSFRALGAEIQLETNIGHGLRLQGAYTYLDAKVTQSFTGSALAPSINPAFPDIPIGAFAPLVGGRPFDRAPQTGSIRLDYEHQKFGLTSMASFVGRRDGSTFLTDGFFGNSMLLPNRNLQAAYQLLDLSGRYAINRHVSAYFGITNLLSQHYQEEIGYPALPLAFRGGLKFTFGGEGGWW
jgi:iron complex outermembrane receptor protein/vitamin B12 transporter